MSSLFQKSRIVRKNSLAAKAELENVSLFHGSAIQTPIARILPTRKDAVSLQSNKVGFLFLTLSVWEGSSSFYRIRVKRSLTMGDPAGNIKIVSDGIDLLFRQDKG